MFNTQDLTTATVRIDAMLAEAKRAYVDAKDMLDYYEEEYNKARKRHNAALDTVERLEEMLRDVDWIRKNEATWRATF